MAIRDAMQRTKAGTPGRWSATVGGILAADPGHDRKWASAMAGTDDPAEPYGVKVAENLKPEGARLICAAVNAVREAMPGLTDAQMAEVIEARGVGVRGYAHTSPTATYDAVKSAQRDCADLAACREALSDILETHGSRDHSRHECAYMAQIARVMLARLDATT